MIRVFIVEDHVIFRDGLKTLLATTPEIEVVGEASSAEEAVARVGESRPDIVLMDVKLPGMSGIEATRHIVAADPSVHVLVITMFDDAPSVFAAMQAGARGYVLKGAAHEELLRAILAVADGEAIFSAAIAERMIHYFSAQNPGRVALFKELTEREHEVLAHLAQGLSNSEIARRLELRPKTVRNHVSNIVSKLQVENRAEAAKRARDRGM